MSAYFLLGCIAETFSFGPRYKLEQFGKAQSQVMSDFVNETQGWKNAKKIWDQRIANRYFPELEEKLGANSTWYKDNFAYLTQTYNNAPEDVVWKEKLFELNTVYEMAKKTYAVVSEQKAQQVEIATKALSGDIISIITDKAMVPAITVKGAAGVVSEFSQVVWEYFNSTTEITDELYNSTIGERLTASKGAEAITKLGTLLDINVKFVNDCIK